MPLEYLKPEKISLLSHADFDEKWVQARIAEDPGLLGLGDLVLKDRERIQPRAGRLDLLFQDSEKMRYEVEVQLGPTDESHIIRTVEYWDREKKKYTQYDHTAVIIAEDITSRFLNVIGLFNGTIPLIAMQMGAIKIGGNISLVFTTVLDQQNFGVIDEDEEVQETTDRAYWEHRGSRETVAVADDILDMIHEWDRGFVLKYNKFYIGLAKNDQPNNFVSFRPKKNFLRLEVRLPRSDELNEQLENAGLELMEYDKRWGKYRIRLAKSDLEKHRVVLQDILGQAYKVAAN